MSDAKVLEALGDVRVHARVALPASAVTLDELARLEPESLVRLELGAATAAELSVNGRVLATGEVVSVGGRRALAITEIP